MSVGAVNVIQLLRDLSESPDEVFHASKMVSECEGGLKYLAELGAIEPGPRPKTVVCNACDADHPGVIEFDANRRCYVHFCPEAGLVTVNDTDLVTCRFRPEWLIDWLVKEIPIISPLRHHLLVEGHVWHLGQAECGDAPVTVIFGRRVTSQVDFDALVAALKTVHPAGKGLVVTTSPHVRQVSLPNGFEFLDLGAIMRCVGDKLIVDRVNFDSLVQGFQGASQPARTSRRDRKEPRRLDYREVDKLLIADMRAMILAGTARNATDAARALASRATGGGEEASKVKRLAGGYLKVYPGS